MPRVVVTMMFAFFVPGRAVAANWPGLATWSEFGVPVVLSLAILTLAATVALWAHAWHPLGLFQAEDGLSMVTLVVGLLRRHAGPGAGAAGRSVRAGYRGGAS
jgi:hypothetical protein